MTTGRAPGLTLSTKTRCTVILRIPKSQTNSRNCRVRIKRLPHRIPGLKRKENASRRSRIRTDRGCEVKKSRVFHPVNSWTDVPNGTKREIRRKNLHHSFSDDPFGSIVVVLSLNRKRGCKPAEYKGLQPLSYHSSSIVPGGLLVIS